MALLYRLPREGRMTARPITGSNSHVTDHNAHRTLLRAYSVRAGEQSQPPKETRARGAARVQVELSEEERRLSGVPPIADHGTVSKRKSRNRELQASSSRSIGAQRQQQRLFCLWAARHAPDCRTRYAVGTAR